MSILRVASALIERAARDENYALDLAQAAQDDVVYDGLVLDSFSAEDFTALAPSDLLWFAEWRQGMGGPLDLTLLRRLTLSYLVGSREFRFRARGLALRDAETIGAAPAFQPEAFLNTFGQGEEPAILLDRPPSEEGALAGLTYLAEEAARATNRLEVGRDAIQYGTEASWFSLRVLTSLEGSDGAVSQWLSGFAESRGVPDEVSQRWYSR